jgi:hypothetical protein
MSLRNIGKVDRILRVVIGVALISLVFWGPQTNWGWVGLIPLVTGFISFCPLYRVMGVSTCQKKS